VSALFIIDPTLRLEGVVTLARWGFDIAAVWGLLGVAGIYALARVTGTRLNGPAWYALGSAVVMIALGPVLIRFPELKRQQVFLSLFWIAGTQLVVAASARSAGSSLARDDAERLRLDNAIRLMAHLAPAGALAHVLVSMNAFDEDLHLAHLVPLLALAPMRARSEVRTWIYAALLLLVMAPQHQALLPCAALLLVVLTYKAHLLVRPRLYVGAVLCLHLVLVAHSHTHAAFPFGASAPWMLTTSIALLLGLAVRYRMPLALACAALLWHFGKPPGHALTIGQWGALLLALGFVALIYALQRDVRRAREQSP
jgi:hypothetical protein